MSSRIDIKPHFDRVKTAISAIKTAISDKGVTVPSDAGIADFPALVDSIEQGINNRVYLVGDNNLTAYIRYFVESNANVNVHNHDITLTKTSDSSGGSGVSSFRAVDVTDYSKLVMTVSATSVRNTDVARYIPHMGLTDTYVTGLSNATYSASVNLCAAGTTSFAEKTVELDLSGLEGEYYVSYQGVASLVITDWHLE